MMNGLLIKFVYVLLIGVILTISKYGDDKIDCQAILVSPVDHQAVYTETRSYIPIAALSSNPGDITFQIEKGPDFVKVRNTENGRAMLIIDPSKKDVGTYKVIVSAENGRKYGCVHFKLKVNKVNKKSRLLHCYADKDSSLPGQNKFGSLESLLAGGHKPVEGDVIILHNGNHGDIIVEGKGFSIFSAANSDVTLSSLQFKNARDILVSGVYVEDQKRKGEHSEYLVYIDSLSSKIDFRNNIIRSTSSSDDWTIEDWNTSVSRGVKCLADDSRIRNNAIQSIFHGIKTEGNELLVLYNHIDRFSGDAIRNTGSYNTFDHNFITNATIDDYYEEGGNHDDLFQSWTFDKPIERLVLSNNVMVSCTDTLIKNRSKIVQGLVCFDGFEKGWTIEHNLIITDHPHGIALYGAKECKIIDNMILRNPYKLYEFESEPWIMINKHKDGRMSYDNEVNNNFSPVFTLISDKVKTSNNRKLDTTYKLLKDYYDWDFRIKK